MAGLVPAIHVLAAIAAAKTWMPGTSPGMTTSLDARATKRSSWPSGSGVLDRPVKPGNDSGERGKVAIGTARR
jgi:hypothetical protein